MTNSINQPWAISDDFRTRYGNTWADLDFVVEEIQKPLTKAEKKAMKHALTLLADTSNAET